MRRLTAGVSCWLGQPAYLLCELVVAGGASAAYSLRDDTVSALGMLTCAPGRAGALVDVCSPWHVALNAAFVVFGLLRVLGAVLLHPVLAAGRARSVASCLWVVSGLCTAAVGLAPVDQRPVLHAAVALPVFLLQPPAVMATAAALRRTYGSVAAPVVRTGLAAGVLTLAATVAFGGRMGEQSWVGGLERLALWPAYLWLGTVALFVARNPGRPGVVPAD